MRERIGKREEDEFGGNGRKFKRFRGVFLSNETKSNPSQIIFDEANSFGRFAKIKSSSCDQFGVFKFFWPICK